MDINIENTNTNSTIINNIINNKKERGRPKLTEEQKAIQKEKRKEYQRIYKIKNKEQLKEKRDEYISKNKQ